MSLTYDIMYVFSIKRGASFYTSGLIAEISYSSETLLTAHKTITFIIQNTIILNISCSEDFMHWDLQFLYRYCVARISALRNSRDFTRLKMDVSSCYNASRSVHILASLEALGCFYTNCGYPFYAIGRQETANPLLGSLLYSHPQP
jgi:hypothetical protein